MKYKICRNCGKKNEYTDEQCDRCGWNIGDPSHYDLEDDRTYEDGEKVIRLWSSNISIVCALILTIITVFFTFFFVKKYFGIPIEDSMRTSETVQIIKDKMGIDILSIFNKKDVVTVSNEVGAESTTKPQKEKIDKKTTKKNTSKYVLKDSSKKIISMKKLRKMSKRKLAIARNEIFARNGYTFKDGEWEKYFSKKSWYRPKYSADYFNNHYEELLNKYEKKNIKRIKKVERMKGD